MPVYSTGQRDPLIQLQYLRAMYGYWANPSNNPTSDAYNGPMVDMSRAHVWAWDARPYPFFPANSELWADGENYARGHWITGRCTGRNLADVVAEVCTSSGVTDFDVSGLYGFVRGYSVENVSDARSALQPLMLAYGFDAVEREGKLHFFNRDGRADKIVTADQLVYQGRDAPVIRLERAAAAEISGRVQLTFVDQDSDFEAGSVEAVFPGEGNGSLTTTELPLALTRSEARLVADRWLAETTLARDGASFTLPPSLSYLGAGDVVGIAEEGGTAHFRIDRVEDTQSRQADAVRVEQTVYEKPAELGSDVVATAFVPALPLLSVFMDLPLMDGDELPHAPHIAVSGAAWPGTAAVYSSATGSNFELLETVSLPASLGEVLDPVFAGPSGILDEASVLRVRLTRGTLASVTRAALLAGANLAAIGDGSAENWELIQFEKAVLVE